MLIRAPRSVDTVADGHLLPQCEVLGSQDEPGHQECSDQKTDRFDDAHGALAGGCGGTPTLLPAPRDGKRRKSLTDNEDEINLIAAVVE